MPESDGNEREVDNRAPEVGPWKRNWSRDEPEAVLDYLHGDTPVKEVEACCYYEYARASDLFLTARRLYDVSDDAGVHISLSPIVTAGSCRLLQGWRGLEILRCAGYPDLPWRELTEAQKKDIVIYFVPSRMLPIATDSFVLKALGVFDKFTAHAETAWTAHQERLGHVPRGQYPAIVGDESGPARYVVLTLDYSRGEAAMKEAVRQWLDSEENSKLFKRFYKKPIDKSNPNSPSRYTGRLKFLAAWRLLEELGFKAAVQWTKDNRRHKDYHPRPFFGQKLRKTTKGMHYSGGLFKELRQWNDAAESAKSFLSHEIER